MTNVGLALIVVVLVLTPVGAALLGAASVIQSRGLQVATSFVVTALVLVWSAAWAVG